MVEALRQTIRKQRWQVEGRPEWFRYVNFTLPPISSRWGLFDWCRSMGGLRSAYLQFQRDRLNPRDRIIFYDHSPWLRTIGDWIPDMLTDTFRAGVYESDLWNPFTIPPPWSGLDIHFTKLICETYLLENGIAQGDRLSMASSVELRLPLVDYRLVETVVGLRKVRPDHALPAKTWLKSAVKDLLPPWLFSLPKRGFQPPGDEWIHGVRTRYGQALEDGLLVQWSILKPEVARVMSRGTQRGPLALLAFTALVLEYWCAAHLGHVRHQVDGSPADPPTQRQETVSPC
jgi:asparagine synthase (glutamine-hydrolysing)